MILGLCAAGDKRLMFAQMLEYPIAGKPPDISYVEES
jgi:hypothetical protein